LAKFAFRSFFEAIKDILLKRTFKMGKKYFGANLPLTWCYYYCLYWVILIVNFEWRVLVEFLILCYSKDKGF